MNSNYPPVEVKVWGDFACFTRPENKVERVSYEVPTPSAARGVLEAIFFHPPMQWRIREIAVLKPVRPFSILRNEVNCKASPQVDGIDIVERRAQRHSLILRDVAYIIRADVYIPPGSTSADPAKYRDQFRRRVERGQCFHRPCLGCREFAADFSPVTPEDKPLELSQDLGLMLFDLDYQEKRAYPYFFNAKLEAGVLRIPPELYEGGGS